VVTGRARPTGDDGDLRFALVAIPLSRADISRFLRDWRVPARGAEVAVIEQRPPAAVRDRWLADLTESSPPTT
jgi:hypothetical protein